MKNIAYFFRHGESTANAGQSTADVSSIDLTPKGVEQAKALARFFPEAPQKTVVSPFLRTRKTAEYALSAFPGIAIETWPIQEFTYLSPQKCAGTTDEQRLPWRTDYWNKADPDYRDDPLAETFRDLIVRVDAVLTRMAYLLEHHRLIAVFGHGIFMGALRWRADNGCGAITSAAMRLYREYARAAPIENATGYRCELAARRLRFADIA